MYAVYLQFVECILDLCDRNKTEWAQSFNVFKAHKVVEWHVKLLNFKTQAVILSVWGIATW